jgi:hypothetical protein
VSGLLKTRIGISAAIDGERASARLAVCENIRRGLGNALLEQQHDRLEQPVRLEPPLHRAVQQQVGQREQAHALVVRHEGAHHHAPARVAGGPACSRWPRRSRSCR